MRDTPVPDSRSISSILVSVETGSSFCRPSRGPTSRSDNAVGISVMIYDANSAISDCGM